MAIVALPSAPQPLTAAIVWGWWLAVAVALMACISRRAEYRADAHAAELLGSPAPVMAMLQRDAAARTSALVQVWSRALTPAPKRRIARLTKTRQVTPP